MDKSVMNAATYLYVCQHNTEDDVKYMAKKLGVPLAKIPRVPLNFLIWSPSKGEISSGHVEFKQSKPVFLKHGSRIRQLKLGSICGTFRGVVGH